MRLWTFGCSFTQYFYPTWADILIEDIANKGHSGQNWGNCGRGNLYISMAIQECHAKNNLGKDDWVLVCWSNYFREDTYIPGKGWHSPACVFSNTEYKDGTVNGFGSHKYYAMRDLALIQATKLSLDALNVKQFHFCIIPLSQRDSQMDKIYSVYNIKLDGPPMMESLDLMIQDEKTKQKRPKTFLSNKNQTVMHEWHPLPWEHLEYIEKHIQPKMDWIDLLPSTRNFVDIWKSKILSYSQPINLDKIDWRQKKFNQWL